MQIYGVVNRVLGSAQFWLILPLALGIVVVVELAARGAKNVFRPTLTTILQERNLYWTAEQKKSAALQLTEEQEQMWAKRKAHRKNKKGIKVPNAEDLGDDDSMKAVIRVMLRFKNLTGGQFEGVKDGHNYETFDQAHFPGAAGASAAN